ncbi:MAG TPA: hypothetical protein VLJ42_10300 [Solirubrobacteraceae bacterium]|nr:hypothetical protein [Solirubrobacteraceae bacterium]
MYRKFVLAVVPVLAVAAFAVMPAVGQASNVKWYTLSAGAFTLLPNSATQVASASDNFHLSGLGGALSLNCLVFNGGTVTNVAGANNGTDSLAIFAQLGGAYPATPCKAVVAGTNCNAGFTTLNNVSPAFTSTLPFATQLSQLTGKIVDTVSRPTYLISYTAACPLVGSTSLAFAAPSLLVFLSNLTPTPVNATAVCSGTIPSTLTATVKPGTVAQGGSGTVQGTQGTPSGQTFALDGTVELWKVTTAVALPPVAQACTGLAVLLTTA